MRVILSVVACFGLTSAAVAGSSITTAAPENAGSTSIIVVGTPAATAKTMSGNTATTLGKLRLSFDDNGVLSNDASSQTVTSETKASIAPPKRMFQSTPVVIRGGEVGGAFNNAPKAAVATATEPVSGDENKGVAENKAAGDAVTAENGGPPNPDLPRVEHQADGAASRAAEVQAVPASSGSAPPGEPFPGQQ